MEHNQYCLASYRTATDLGKALDALNVLTINEKRELLGYKDIVEPTKDSTDEIDK